MNRKYTSVALVLAAILSAPAFAESAGDSGGSSGPGSPGGPTMGSSGAIAPYLVTPNSAMAGAVASSTPSMRDPGGPVLALAPSTTVLGGPASTTVVTYSYLHVPANVEQRADFQRWLRLR